MVSTDVHGQDLSSTYSMAVVCGAVGYTVLHPHAQVRYCISHTALHDQAPYQNGEGESG